MGQKERENNDLGPPRSTLQKWRLPRPLQTDLEPPSKAQERFVDVSSAIEIFHKRGAVDARHPGQRDSDKNDRSHDCLLGKRSSREERDRAQSLLPNRLLNL
jgi:hypothetical protein